MSIDNKDKVEFARITKTMNLPEDRRELTQPNARWFLRNGMIQNRDHLYISDAMQIARKNA